jgi:hypothetical protein
MAVPIVIYGRPDVLAFWGVHEGNIPGIVLLALVAFMLSRVGGAAARTGGAGT